MPGEGATTILTGSRMGSTPKSLVKMRDARASSTASSTYFQKMEGCAKEFFWGKTFVGLEYSEMFLKCTAQIGRSMF